MNLKQVPQLAHSYNPYIWKAEFELPYVGGKPGLHSEFKAHLYEYLSQK